MKLNAAEDAIIAPARAQAKDVDEVVAGVPGIGVAVST
jgi:hypothetical protein